MRWRYILHIVGVLIFFVGLSMIFSLLVSFYYQDQSVWPLAKSMGITVITGFLMFMLTRSPKTDYVSHREGMAIVTIGWIIVGLFGALPFYIGGPFDLFVDAYFESVSGFTTTGSSVLTNIEAVSKGLLFWRSFIQWLGEWASLCYRSQFFPFWAWGGCSFTRPRSLARFRTN